MIKSFQAMFDFNQQSLDVCIFPCCASRWICLHFLQSFYFITLVTSMCIFLHVHQFNFHLINIFEIKSLWHVLHWRQRFIFRTHHYWRVIYHMWEEYNIIASRTRSCVGLANYLPYCLYTWAYHVRHFIIPALKLVRYHRSSQAGAR